VAEVLWLEENATSLPTAQSEAMLRDRTGPDPENKTKKKKTAEMPEWAYILLFSSFLV
jgi:hypothetical protein